MKVTRESVLTGKVNTMELPITQERLDTWERERRQLVQDAFPELTKEQREFLITGSTQEEWNAMFKVEDLPQGECTYCGCDLDKHEAHDANCPGRLSLARRQAE